MVVLVSTGSFGGLRTGSGRTYLRVAERQSTDHPRPGHNATWGERWDVGIWPLGGCVHEAGLGPGCYLGEGVGVVEGQVGEDLAVDLHVREL